MTTAAGSSIGRRVALLAAQAICLGLLTAWVLIPSSALFLEDYGSDLLPWTYIGAAIAAVGSTAALNAALGRRPLAVVAQRVLAVQIPALVTAWMALVAGVAWMSFALLVLVPMLVPIGFMFVVGQAGMLLDVRALKARYGRVIAGFAGGFVAGGLLGPMAIDLTGRTEDLLLGAAATSAVLFGLIALTRAGHADALDIISGEEHGDGPGIRALLDDRYLVLIMGFQALSAVESQWLDFLVFDRAAARYQDAEDLARFLGRFTAIAYGADILFLLLLAGLLMRRFGLRYGLTANPSGVLAVVTAVVLVSVMQGAASTAAFALVVGARVTDLVLSDGASRNALSAAYQVVVPQRRQAGQAFVEGLVVPVFIGVSGVGLLVIRATVGTGGLTVPSLTAVIVAGWVVVGLRVYQRYRVGLLESLRHRTLDPGGLPIDDPSSLQLIDQLIDSDDLREVRVGLDALDAGAHPALADRLVRFAERDVRTDLRTEALERLVRVDPPRAAETARVVLDDPLAPVRAAAAGVLALTGEPGDLGRLVRHELDPDPRVQARVASAMARLGDDATRRAVSGRIAGLAASARDQDRLLAASMLGRCARRDGIERSALGVLLADSHTDVVVAALDAMQHPDDDDLVDDAARRLHDPTTAAAAADALVRAGPAGLDAAARILDRLELDRRAHGLAARVCREIGGDAATDVLLRHLDHPDREVSLAVLRALGAIAGHPLSPELDVALSTLVRADLEHASRVLGSLVLFRDEAWADLLSDALADERDLLRRRLGAALGVRHGPDALRQVTHQLSGDDLRAHALALEWLEVTLAIDERPAVALLEPGLSDLERHRRLGGGDPGDVDERLDSLLHDPAGQWRSPWVQASALHAVTRRGPDGRGGVAIVPSVPDPDGILAETLVDVSWHEVVTER